MDSAAVLQQLTSLVGAALKTLSAIRDAGHLASPNSQQNKNETARVLPLNMAVSKSLDKGLGELPVESALIHYQIYRFGSCSLLPLGTIAA